MTAWQGIRNNGTVSGEYLICGSTNTTTGLLYIGPIAGGGSSFTVVLTWTPQRAIWAALAVSAATLLLCLVLVVANVGIFVLALRIAIPLWPAL